MIKLTFCLRRRPDLTKDAFLRYWREEHAARVRPRMAVLGMRRYVQLRALDGPLAEAIARSRGGPEPFDGVAEIWFDDVDSLARHGGTEAGKAAAKELFKDEQSFIDLKSSVIFLAEEQLSVEAGL
jgi:uncharacterized protein (TIGR02118 family)